MNATNSTSHTDVSKSTASNAESIKNSNNTNVEINESIKPDEPFLSVLSGSGYNSSLDLQGAIVSGIVVDKNDAWVTIDAGFKSESMISKSEFSQEEFQSLKLGDVIEVYVISFTTKTGEAVLSYEKRVREQIWQQLESYQRDGRIIEGKVIARAKRGFVVEIGGRCSAFLPYSHADFKSAHYSSVIGSKSNFQIMKMDQSRGAIVLSRKMVTDTAKQEEDLTDASEIHVKEGDVVRGVVKNIAAYGAFIDIGEGVGGLLHVSDMSWSRVHSISSILAVGDEVDVKVLSINQQTGKVSLGMKHLTTNPWDENVSKYKVGDEVEVKVVSCAEYGAFVEIEEGIEGLIHVSEFEWGKRSVNPNDYLKKDDKIKVVVVEIDQERQRIRFSIRKTGPNHAKEFVESNPVGTKIKVKVNSVTFNGLSVSIDGDERNINGVINVYEIPGYMKTAKDKKAILSKYNKGDSFEAALVGYDVNNAIIMFSLTKMIPDPIENLKSKVGDIVECIVKEFTEYGICVEFKNEEGVYGFIKSQDLSKDRYDRRVDMFKIGQEISAMITAIDKNSDRRFRKIMLSIKALHEHEAEQYLGQYDSESSGQNLGTLLGDIDIDQDKKK